MKTLTPRITNEYGLYDGSWKGVITPDSFQHPAKMPYGLLVWIIETGLERGYWQRGELLGDPFGGIGSTGIIGASHGLRVVLVELESRFVELAKQNFELHRHTWQQFGDPLPVIVQGDSREFARIVGEVCGAVTSPPYAESVNDSEGNRIQWEKAQEGGRNKTLGRAAFGKVYGQTPGQIGSLKAGTLNAAITSPPYAESIKGDHKETETAAESRAKRNTPGGSLGQSQRHGGYGATEGNIGNLKEGAVDGCVTSPPWAKQMNTGGADGDRPGNLVRKWAESRGRNPDAPNCLAKYEQYGDSPDNIGNTSSQTYWQAMRQVYEQVYLALKPGAVFCAVLKDYVKNKQRVPLCDDTCALLTSVGFHVFERTRAWVVQETREPSLFGGEVVKTKSRKSFFRRLAEAKGSPPIDWEEVIWCTKPDYEPPEAVA
ncbi:hypothetical protein LCGC14_0643370 [marine sediment metagenome]|uniref:DNA methylase N-4/N-6 domain-containing protein n=1 Tax=marine sediment metagenome TaxID=412755 RepID=A0A0F9TK42_9ZZZZ